MRLVGSVVAVAAILWLSAVPSYAVTCSPQTQCFPTGNFGFVGVVTENVGFVDDFTFDVSGPPNSYNDVTNEITGSGGTIDNLTIAIYTIGGMQKAISIFPGFSSGSQTIAVSAYNLIAGDEYYVQVSGSGVAFAPMATSLTYSGTNTFSPASSAGALPLPAAIVLFAGGLGLLGFAGSRRHTKKQRLPWLSAAA